MTILHDRRFSSWARGHLLCRVEGIADRFALTFDDGPSSTATAPILDLLARHGAKATFFTLAPHVRARPGLLRRMVEEGHEAAAHGHRHWPLTFLPPWELRREVESSMRAVYEVTGVRPRHYRPPFGFMMPGQAWFVRKLGVEPVLGDVYPEDPHRPGTDAIVARVMPRLRGGSILILHDGTPLGEADRRQTVAALGVILERVRSRGLRAVTVRELLASEPAHDAAIDANSAPSMPGGPSRVTSMASVGPDSAGRGGVTPARTPPRPR
jgi:peptidoglycan/xylan/chitin deacetylase (PgdA/CDA1 family)